MSAAKQELLNFFKEAHLLLRQLHLLVYVEVIITTKQITESKSCSLYTAKAKIIIDPASADFLFSLKNTKIEGKEKEERNNVQYYVIPVSIYGVCQSISVYTMYLYITDYYLHGINIWLSLARLKR